MCDDKCISVSREFPAYSIYSILDVWELREVVLYGDNPSVQQIQSLIASWELQGIAGGRGELRCLGGETDTSCLYGARMFVC